MIEISFGKLILLALVALIVLGPEKLPGAARTAGALLRRLRSGWDNVRAEVERELEIEEIRRAAREAAARAEAAQAELDSAVRQVRDPLAQAAAKAGETFRLTGEAQAGQGPAAEHASLSGEGASDGGATAEREQGQGQGLPLTQTLSPEKSLGGEGFTRGEIGTAVPDFRPELVEEPIPEQLTGQLFDDAPLPTEPADATTRKAAHGGH